MPARPTRLERDRSQLLVIDVQERLAPHVEGRDELVARCEALISAASGYAIPKLLTEHCAAQLGPVITRLRARFAPEEIFAKTRFGAADHADFASHLRRGRDQVVVAGMEAHVCVMQTVLGLVDLGLQVFVAGDAVGSRPERAADRGFALTRMREAGCTIAGTETLLFEWTRSGDDPRFRETLRLAKGLPR